MYFSIRNQGEGRERNTALSIAERTGKAARRAEAT
jgi:hypothetical protein